MNLSVLMQSHPNCYMVVFPPSESLFTFGDPGYTSIKLLIVIACIHRAHKGEQKHRGAQKMQ